MKQKVKQWIQTRLRDLIMWAAGDYFAETLKQHLVTLTTTTHAARDHLARENAKQWRLLNDKITALQAIDTALDGRDRGKIIIIATVRGQDIIKILDIPRGTSIDEHRRMIKEIEERYGARPEFLDAPAGERTFMAEYLGMPGDATRRAAARDRGFMR